MAGPLAGIRVLEAANFVSGPFASMLLADLGAEVWKIEMPGTGDPFRKWGGRRGGVRPQFAAYNRGKKSIALNLSTEEGQEAFRRLAERCDVVIDNFRPGTLDKFGIGYDQLHVLNPRLVYCGISGMGRTGPLARRPSYDSIGLALSGLWSRFVDLTAPEPIGPQVADQITALFAVQGILAALIGRQLTGLGQRVDLSMFLAAMAFIPEPVANYLALGELGTLTSRPSRSQAYALVARDGLPLTVHLSSVTKFWEGLVRAIERPELLTDERFSSSIERVEHYLELRAILGAVFRERDREEWLRRLEAEDVPCAPINSVAEAVDSPQSKSLGAIRTYGEGPRAVRLVREALDFSASQVPSTLPPPEIGEHSVEVLTAAGYEAADIAALQAKGVLAVSEGHDERRSAPAPL